MDEISSTNIQGYSFELPQRYRINHFIGAGGYGVVVAAFDCKTKRQIAVKKMSPFRHQTYTQRAYREVKLMANFVHENIITMLDIIVSQSSPDCYEDIYIIQPLMSCDLAHVIQNEKLGVDHVCYFLYQILRGLKYLHSAHVIHRDLKPSNLLVNSECDLKICDFGLSRIQSPAYDHTGMMTEYVATRWYRAPEIMLNSKCYTGAVDIWSVGCILAEMISRKVLFPGIHYIDQLNKILSVIGSPTVEDTAFILNEKARMFVNGQPYQKKANFYQLLKTPSAHAVDLIDKMLTFHPDKRITVNEAITHPYLQDYHDEADEPLMRNPFSFENELDNLPKETLTKMILDEVVLFKKNSTY